MPTVDFARTIGIPSDQETVWSVVTDVATVAGWVSIVGQVEEIAPLADYQAVLSDQIGPFKLKADLSVNVTELDPPERIGFIADGEDRQVGSRIRIAAVLVLRRTGESTEVEVQGSYEVTGRVATLGAGLIRTKGDKILDEFFDSISQAFV
jgi:carbon monoxide dehydrogenase subunit G